MAKRQVFKQTTPLGEVVVLSRDRWREIVRFKHPALAGHERDVRECLRDPKVVRESLKDAGVWLYYRSFGRGYVCVVVGGEQATRFVITAYFTKNIKQGPTLWTK